MELDDIFYIGRRPTTLRMVLGLMEDADNSLETYHWATPALLHAIYTNDKMLSQYVEEVFQRKGMAPYVPNKKEEDKPTEKTPEKMTMDKHVMWSKAKMAIEELMSLKDAKGGDLFCQKNHWWAVFRLFVDLQVCNIRENRYKEFIELIDSLGLVHVNAPLDMTTLSNITQDIFRFPFTKWDQKIPKDASSRWMTAYTRLYQIAESLHRILIAKGF